MVITVKVLKHRAKSRLLKHLANKMGSYMIMKLERSSPVRDSLFQKTLATEEAVACLKRKTSVQWKNTQTMIKTYFYPLDGESCMKCICQTLNCL